ncbi:hypothetical protein KIW84_020914 [Lathyrus oleraceus]|uniref:Uncharacterized protein n=1 Tax=Pisum sativum TaxID=3888 RepID=A0A9D4YAD1_PEA|nr:hypothetical protein KIW84_020914 [Pisum sativum]
MEEAEWVRTRYEELSLIEEKRLAAICHGQLYQQRMKRAFDQKVRPRVYHVGDLVLKRILPPQNDRRAKWTPNYEGPFVVKKVFSGGALLLTTMDGKDFPSPVNADAVIKILRIRDPLDEKNKIVQVKRGIPANRKKMKTEISQKRLVQKAESVESLEDIWVVTGLELDEITGAIGNSHSLVGCDAKRSDERSLVESNQGQGVEERVRISREYKVMNQKSPDESGSSQKWKVDTVVRCWTTVLDESTGVPCQKFCTSPADSRSVFPSRFEIVISPADSRSVSLQQPSVLWLFSPVKSPSRPGSVEVVPSEDYPFPSRVEIGVILSSSAEWLVPSLEGDIFYAFII